MEGNSSQESSKNRDRGSEQFASENRSESRANENATDRWKNASGMNRRMQFRKNAKNGAIA